MQQRKLTGYRPNYPRKALRGAALTAAALMAVGGAAGCRWPGPATAGVAMTPEPTEQTLILDGEVAIAEPTEEPVLQGKIAVTEPPEEELITDGEEMIEMPEPTPEVPFRTTGVLLIPTDTPEA